MKVTKFNYPLELHLVKKLDLMVKRCDGVNGKRDVVLIFEGDEGNGKTTYSVAVGYYIAKVTGRKFNSSNVFFDANKLIDYGKNTEGQILIWDEPSLQALSTDYRKNVVVDLTRFLMTARKKRHFIMINMTKFYKFNEYIVVDRAIALIHVYSRKNSGNEPLRFVYIRKKNLEALWNDYKFKKKRNYKKYSERHIRGTFPNILDTEYKNNVLSDFDIEDYENRKDAAIMGIGKKEDKENTDLLKLKYAYATLKGVKVVEKAKHISVNRHTIADWTKIGQKYPKILEKKRKMAYGRVHI